MISVNRVIGQFNNITTEQVISVPNASKIIFICDNAPIMVSINGNDSYMFYKNSDGIIEFINDPANSLYITKIYIKAANISCSGSLRIWALI